MHLTSDKKYLLLVRASHFQQNHCDTMLCSKLLLKAHSFLSVSLLLDN